MEWIAALIILLLTAMCGVLFYALSAEKQKAADKADEYAAGMQSLVNQYSDRERELTDKFLLDIRKLTDKILKSRGISPINEPPSADKDTPEPFRLESSITRRAREKQNAKYTQNI